LDKVFFLVQGAKWRLGITFMKNMGHVTLQCYYED
jgi:hypothetical protein